MMSNLLAHNLDLFDPSPILSNRGISSASNSNNSELAEKLFTQPLTAQIFQHPEANREIKLGATVVSYFLTRVKRRSIGFVIGSDGLVVRAPRWVPIYEIEAALQEKSRWITRKLLETKEGQSRRSERQINWANGVCFPYLGQEMQLVLDPAHAFSDAGASLSEESGKLLLKVALPDYAVASQIRDFAQAWLMRRARDNFISRLDHFAPQLGVKWVKLSLSNAKTLWGTASATGAIRLNWRLIHCRQEVVDYVVVHELSHLRVMNHSPHFWETVRSVMPDYPERKNQLRSQEVPFWG